MYSSSTYATLAQYFTQRETNAYGAVVLPSHKYVGVRKPEQPHTHAHTHTVQTQTRYNTEYLSAATLCPYDQLFVNKGERSILLTIYLRMRTSQEQHTHGGKKVEKKRKSRQEEPIFG